ncbi:hypothetical protein C440_16891 [Haloferax mucosum ATCC BAA-1512]|uniref:Uncharacterized protein n=1 Tax=Haloferax mucosum ATCC BAA-1512 TaxID=662479 RepID=M0I0L0_9EURY|nr:hypothetical protein C440_16891 [Haloferax mucosum ATCC BAA-1512]
MFSLAETANSGAMIRFGRPDETWGEVHEAFELVLGEFSTTRFSTRTNRTPPSSFASRDDRGGSEERDRSVRLRISESGET